MIVMMMIMTMIAMIFLSSR